jgi:hypothetical protein
MICPRNKTNGAHVGYQDRDIQNDGSVIVRSRCALCGMELQKVNPIDQKQKTADQGDTDYVPQDYFPE